MKTPAETARRNAISFEVLKDGLQQRQSGDWTLRVTVAAVDMDQRIVTAPMGTRFACVLVEVNDDETPRDHKSEERNKWRDLGPVKQAGIRCKDPLFWAYLKEDLHFNVINEHFAAEAVRKICGIESRSELDKPNMTGPRTMWHDLDFGFQAWKARENA